MRAGSGSVREITASGRLLLLPEFPHQLRLQRGAQRPDAAQKHQPAVLPQVPDAAGPGIQRLQCALDRGEKLSAVACQTDVPPGLLKQRDPQLGLQLGDGIIQVWLADVELLGGFASSIPQLYLFYGILAGAGAGTIYPACLPTALKWFPDKSGSISGLVQAGASCGPFIMSPIAQWLISTYGAQMACRILAVVFLIGVGAVAWMIVPCPEGWLPEGWTPTAAQAKELNVKNYNIPQMVKTPVFWVMLIMFIFANAAGTMMVSATSPIVKNVFGSKYYNRNYGLIFIGYGIGAFVGPKISASFYDSTGSYVAGYIGSAILAALAVVLVFAARKLTASMQEKG